VRALLLYMIVVAGCARSEPPNGLAPCCVSSTSAPSGSVSSSSPEDAFRLLLTAMRDGDDAVIARLTTPAGLASLERGVGDEDKRVAFARWGKGWSAWELRFGVRTDTRAEAALGPEAKEHGLLFVRTTEGWKLSQWTPGE
jgi:hypothetical protein